MAEPPSELGAVNVTDAFALPAVAEPIVGAPGAVAELPLLELLLLELPLLELLLLELPLLELPLLELPLLELLLLELLLLPPESPLPELLLDPAPPFEAEPPSSFESGFLQEETLNISKSAEIVTAAFFPRVLIAFKSFGLSRSGSNQQSGGGAPSRSP